MSDFKDQVDYCKAVAISNVLNYNELALWRAICRSYSRTFSTPLHMCLDGTIPVEDILLATFEHQLEDFSADEGQDLENILEQIYTLQDPDYANQKKEELEEFIDKAEMEEQERLKAGKPIHPALKDEVTLIPKKKMKKKEIPKEGGINLAYLSSEEEEN